MFTARTLRRSALTLTGASVLGLALAGCQTVPMKPAPTAQAVECAYVTLALPDDVAGLPKRGTNAQATSAWGNPARILYRCGVDTPPPSSDGCVSVNGVDWIRDDSEAPMYRFTTYGRAPAVEVMIDGSPEAGVSGTTALTDISDAVTKITATDGCVGAEELQNATPTPTPTP